MKYLLYQQQESICMLNYNPNIKLVFLRRKIQHKNVSIKLLIIGF